MTDPLVPKFYSLPAVKLEVGMSTDDGQDVLAVTVYPDGLVAARVYTPRADDPAQDAANRCEPDGVTYDPGERVGLAVFEDTEVDGSGYPDARPMPGSWLLDPT